MPVPSHGRSASLDRVNSCRSFKFGEVGLVSGVHTLVAGVVQVYHRLQVVEEEEKVRKVEKEVERENQGEETAHMKMTMDGDGKTQT